MKHILIVDDEEAVGYVFERYLAIKGYRVSVAYSGEQALQAFDAGAHDLVVTDYKMPGMNGDELLRRLRSLDPALPAVMISANPIEVGPPLEGVRLFPKPVSLDTLVEHIDAVLRRAAAHRFSGSSAVRDWPIPACPRAASLRCR